MFTLKNSSFELEVTTRTASNASMDSNSLSAVSSINFQNLSISSRTDDDKKGPWPFESWKSTLATQDAEANASVTFQSFYPESEPDGGSPSYTKELALRPPVLFASPSPADKPILKSPILQSNNNEEVLRSPLSSRQSSANLQAAFPPCNWSSPSASTSFRFNTALSTSFSAPSTPQSQNKYKARSVRRHGTVSPLTTVTSFLAPSPASSQISQNDLQDEWGETVKSPPQMNTRKRKIVSISGHTGEMITNTKNFTSEEAINNHKIYEALRSNSKVLKLVLEFMSGEQLRAVAPTSQDWCQLGYQVLRRRIGNQVFSLLRAVEISDSHPILLEQHFHPSFLNTALNSNEDEEGYESADNEDQGDYAAVISKRCGYLHRLNKKKKPSAVTTIISFGNSNIEQKMMEAETERGLPKMDAFVYVIGSEIIFTTPDKRRVRDSWSGVKTGGILNSSSESESDENETNNEFHSGNFLSSLCFPTSVSFSINISTLCAANKYGKVRDSDSKNIQNMGETKAVLIFKMYDDAEVASWTAEILNTAFYRGCKSLTFLSGEFYFMGSSVIDSDSSLTAFAISFLSDAGDTETSFLALDIDEDIGIEKLDQKFSDISFFVQEEGEWLRGRPFFFGLMISFKPLGNSSVGEYKFISLISQRFHALFPSIPLQGIFTDKPLGFCKDATTKDINRLCYPNSTSDKPRTVILLVRYYVD